MCRGLYFETCHVRRFSASPLFLHLKFAHRKWTNLHQSKFVFHQGTSHSAFISTSPADSIKTAPPFLLFNSTRHHHKTPPPQHIFPSRVPCNVLCSGRRPGHPSGRISPWCDTHPSITCNKLPSVIPNRGVKSGPRRRYLRGMDGAGGALRGSKTDGAKKRAGQPGASAKYLKVWF